MLAVGMLPPPMGGQALMFKRAVDALQKDYDLDADRHPVPEEPG